MNERKALKTLVILMAALLWGLEACGDGGGSYVLGPEAQVSVTPSVLVFPALGPGEEARLNVTFEHVGSGGVVRLDPIRLEGLSEDITIGVVEKDRLGPGEQGRIQVLYRADGAEPEQGELVVGLNVAGRTEARIPIVTPGHRGRLVALPAEIDFGIVQGGVVKTTKVAVSNVGTGPVTLKGVEIEGEDKADFEVRFDDRQPILPQGTATVEIDYAPSGRNQDRVMVSFTTDREDVSLKIPVRGEEETPILVTKPSMVQLGWVAPGELKGATVYVTNEGNAPLELDEIVLEDGGNPLELTQVPALPLVLEPDEAISLGLLFHPQTELPMLSVPMAHIQIRSNDVVRDPYQLPIWGGAGVPSLWIFPDSMVDFAYVAPGFTARRTVVVTNRGSRSVSVTGAELQDASTDEFAFDPGPLPIELFPGQSHVFELFFSNTREIDRSETAKFLIESDDPLVPEYMLDVVAGRANRATCEAAFVPELLAMGAFAAESTGRGILSIMNTGSGNCEYEERIFDACRAETFGISQRFVCDDRQVFNPFRVLSEPAPRTVIGPGEELHFEIAFDAPAQVSSAGRDSYYARLSSYLFDPNAQRSLFVGPRGGVGRGVNIHAQAAKPRGEVTPPSIHFGGVRTDCLSATQQVRARADGPADLTVTGVSSADCGDDLRIEGPELPATVSGFRSLYWDLIFTPQEPGPMTCSVQVETNAANIPLSTVVLEGSGVDETARVDLFAQAPDPKVDVLLVIDDSYSMADDQERLAEQLPRLLALAQDWSQDFHIGITTTDTIKVRGQLQGFPRFADQTTDMQSFAANVMVGTAGYHIEMGLEGAYLALYDRAQQTGLACNPNLAGQCPRDADGLGLICVEGLCSGRNTGFLRDDAELVIIIISDEEDSSPETVGWYLRQFTALKAPGSGVGVTVHSVIVPPEGCVGGFGVPGRRYIQASEATGGQIVSICAPDFVDQLDRVADRTFGLKERFYPSMPPDPSTLEVRVEGELCERGRDWQWHDATQAVVFQEGALCEAGHGEEISVAYEIACVAPR